MSTPSKWPLPADGIRFLTPVFMLNKMARHPLTRECYPAAMGYYPTARSHRMVRRRHDNNLLIYCVDGLGHARTDQWAGQVGAGDLLLLPQGVAHEYYADPDQPWNIYWIHFQGSGTAVFNQYLGYSETGSPVTQVGVSPRLTAQFMGLLDVHQTGYNIRAFINAANHPAGAGDSKCAGHQPAQLRPGRRAGLYAG